MDTTEVSSRSRGFKILVIVLLVLAISLLGIIGYFTIFGGENNQLVNLFSSSDEYTFLLEEFVVNLQTEENYSRNYLKTEIALMYTDNKQEETLNINTHKIRDTIINQLRLLTSEEILNGDNTPNLKSILTESINTALGEEVIKDVYFSDLIIQ